MKKALLVFDQYINAEVLRKKLHFFGIEAIEIMPLTSNWDLIENTERICRLASPKIREIKLLDSARLINDEVDEIRDRVSAWATKIGDYKIEDKTFKEWFFTPSKEVSTWWFSLVSEKNTVKTDTFFRIAQIQAIDKIISSGSFDLFIFSVCEEKLLVAFKKLCERLAISELCLSSFSLGIKSHLKKKSIFNLMLKSLFHLSIHIFRAIKAKWTLGPLRNRKRVFENAVIFVSYFPLIDNKAAEKGILRNIYAGPLQQKILDEGKNIIWIWMYVFLEGHRYADALKFAKKFMRNGETNFFLEEFLSTKMLFSIFYSWLHQIRIFLRLKNRIPEDILYKDLSVPEAAILIKNLMVESFIGPVGIEGIYYFELYKRVFSYFAGVSHCFYYAEMHAWEKALNAAKDLKNTEIKTVGFQHTNVSQNLFHYFHHYKEIQERTILSKLPLPDILACNGEIPCELLRKQGYPNVFEVEAVRQFYLFDYLKNDKSIKKSKEILLVAVSFDAHEASLLLSLLYDAFKGEHAFEVWIKAHPSISAFKVLNSLNIDYKKCGYEIKNDRIDILLKDATMVLVGTSNVGLEALLFKCKVFVPIFSERMHISPLAGLDKLYTKIYSPKELKESIEECINDKDKKNDSDLNVDFITKYWCLDKTLKRWGAVLK